MWRWRGRSARGGGLSLRLVPLSLEEANAFVISVHRHHGTATGHKFSLGAADASSRIVGVAIVGRPVSRHLDNGMTLEVNRVAVDGTRNACSFLLSAAWRAAKALGYERLITYTLTNEPGASLRGAGWRLIGMRGGGNWNVPSRPRVDTAALLAGQKQLWEAV